MKEKRKEVKRKRKDGGTLGSVTESAAPERNSRQEEMVTIGLTKTHSLALMVRVSDWRRKEGADCHAAQSMTE